MVEAIEKVAEWLEKMDLTLIRVEDEPKVIVNYQIEDHVFQVQLIASDQWINAKALVAFVEGVSKPELQKLYRNVLVANWSLNEVTFSADPDQGNIWCETDMPADTTFENFEIEFSSIPFGIKHFINEIAPTIAFDVQDTALYV